MTTRADEVRAAAMRADAIRSLLPLLELDDALRAVIERHRDDVDVELRRRRPTSL